VIDSGITLHIDTGAVIQFKPGDMYQDERGLDGTKSELIVLGNLIVNGTAANPVQFVATEKSFLLQNGWGGIVVDTMGSVKMRHALIGQARYGYRNSSVRDSAAIDTLEYVRIENCIEEGMILNDWVALLNVTIDDVGPMRSGIRLDAYADSSYIRHCSLINCYWGIKSVASATIDNCTFHDISGGTLSAAIQIDGDCDMTVDSCVIDSSSKGIIVNDTLASVAVSRSDISVSVCGILNTKQNSICKVEGTNFYQEDSCACLVKCDGGNTDLGGGHHSSVGWNRFNDPPPSNGYYLYNNSSEDTAYAKNCCWDGEDWQQYIGTAGGPVDTQSDDPYGPDCSNTQPMEKAFMPETDEDTETVPEYFSVDQNYPNPFNPTTTIDYALPSACHVTIVIYNVLGQQVKTLVDNDREAGVYNAVWDGCDKAGQSVASGMYFYQMIAGDYVSAKKMIVLK